ncbi:Cleavage induced protein [Phytophthora megakarya]|uniref:Cleavage induced protein n=1 Tax=Phytophthora megakarya TaxID=4795 RepID=A0A225UEK1_9STRA|nr:Cleavage induced protein [Phytophthora megakarya]
MLLRILAIHKVRHGFYTSTYRVTGSDNTMADAGIRVQIPRNSRHLSRTIAHRGSSTDFTEELHKGMSSMGCVHLTRTPNSSVHSPFIYESTERTASEWAKPILPFAQNCALYGGTITIQQDTALVGTYGTPSCSGVSTDSLTW